MLRAPQETFPLLLLFLLLPMLPLLKSPRAVFSHGVALLLLSLLAPVRPTVGLCKAKFRDDCSFLMCRLQIRFQKKKLVL
jgi:hypothetical protein